MPDKTAGYKSSLGQTKASTELVADQVQRGSGAKTGIPKARGHQRAGTVVLSAAEKESVDAMIRYGMKRTFNYSKPKYGIKGYHLRDSQMEDGIYRIDKIAV